MGIIKIALEDEKGKQIQEVEGKTYLLDRLLPSLDDKTYQCLHFIDPYGDTVFNRLQMEPFITEWEQITHKAKTEEEKFLVERVKQLAEKCRSEPHLYLKFYGD